jgi:hypothetical protein
MPLKDMKQIDLGKIPEIKNRAIGLKKSFLKLIKRKKKNGTPKSDNHKK